MNQAKQTKSTLLGLGALGLWGLEPFLISEVNTLPIFELLTILFASSFCLTAVRLTVRKRWSLITRQPIYMWLVGVLGVCASDFTYIFGSQLAPIAHIELIDYLWPCLAVGFSCLLFKEGLSFRKTIGFICGIGSVYFLVAKEVNAGGFNMHYMLGYGMALFGAILWGGYSAISSYHKKVPTEMIGMYCGLGALICMSAHLGTETFVMPTVKQGSLVVITGITGAGIAYQFWDYGVKFGNMFMLGMMTYVTRVGGMALLVLFGKEPFSVGLVLACLFATLGVFISTLEKSTYSKLRGKFTQWSPINKVSPASCLPSETVPQDS